MASRVEYLSAVEELDGKVAQQLTVEVDRAVAVATQVTVLVMGARSIGLEPDYVIHAAAEDLLPNHSRKHKTIQVYSC